MPIGSPYVRDPKKMDQYDLMRLYKIENGGPYFDEGNLRFFGEVASEMRLTPKFVTVIQDGEEHEAYELRLTRRRYAFEECEAFHVFSYFDSKTLSVITNSKEKLG